MVRAVPEGDGGGVGPVESELIGVRPLPSVSGPTEQIGDHEDRETRGEAFYDVELLHRRERGEQFANHAAHTLFPRGDLFRGTRPVYRGAQSVFGWVVEKQPLKEVYSRPDRQLRVRPYSQQNLACPGCAHVRGTPRFEHLVVAEDEPA
jgi:hypothetical protein